MASLFKRTAQPAQIAVAEVFDRSTHVLYAVDYKDPRSDEEVKEVISDVFSRFGKLQKVMSRRLGRRQLVYTDS